jgi:6-phosphofructokinase 1
MVFNDMHVIDPTDYEAAKQYVDDPAEFDFWRILNWEFNSAVVRH